MKSILFVSVLYLLYAQISHFDEVAWSSFHLSHIYALVLVVLLMVPNIWLAYKKWELTLSTIEISATRDLKVQSFFAGVVTGLLTPNMLGNFVGRFYYFEKSKRANITAFTMLSNFGQFLASITFGAISVFWLGEFLVWKEAHELLYVILFTLVIGYLIFFFLDNFLGRIRKFKFSTEFRSILKKNPWYRTQILALSFARFMVFTLQFSLMLHAFGVEWNLYLIAAIWQVYLLTMIAPSLFLGKIGVRESISLLVLSQLGLNEVSILVSSTLIWLINTLTPALIGLIVCRKPAVE